MTFNDYRKLMMDVEVIEREVIYINGEATEQTTYSGVKNAWINCVKNDGEKEIFINRRKSELSLEPIPDLDKQESYFVKTLYDVLVEFDKNDKYGDLNENKLNFVSRTNKYDIDGEVDSLEDKLNDFLGISFFLSIEFPRWDESNLDWENASEIADKTSNGLVKISVFNDPIGFEWEFVVKDNLEVEISAVEKTGNTPIDGEVKSFLQDFIYKGISSLIDAYSIKVQKIQEVICAVKAKLNANRNLCDDFFRFHALKIEEIILCTDIELAADADVETVEAEILLAISDFLAPKVYFYTIEEMRNKCRNAHRYPIALSIEIVEFLPSAKN